MEVKENISITSLDAKDVEYIYLLHEREFLRLQQPIFKLGKTKQSHNKRMCGYPKGSQLLLQILSNNCDEDEKKLLTLFRQQFKPRIDIGAEYFEGDRDQMIVSIVQNVDFKRKQPQQITLQVSETPSGIKSYIIIDQDKTHVLVANNCETEQKKEQKLPLMKPVDTFVYEMLQSPSKWAINGEPIYDRWVLKDEVLAMFLKGKDPHRNEQTVFWQALKKSLALKNEKEEPNREKRNLMRMMVNGVSGERLRLPPYEECVERFNAYMKGEVISPQH